MRKLRRLLELPQRPVDEVPRRAVRPRRTLTRAEQAELIDSYCSGETVRSLAERFGIHRETVSSMLERAGVARRYHQTVDVDLDRADELVQSGMTLTDVAKVLGVGRTTLVRARRNQSTS